MYIWGRSDNHFAAQTRVSASDSRESTIIKGKKHRKHVSN